MKTRNKIITSFFLGIIISLIVELPLSCLADIWGTTTIEYYKNGQVMPQRPTLGLLFRVHRRTTLRINQPPRRGSRHSKILLPSIGCHQGGLGPGIRV